MSRREDFDFALPEDLIAQVPGERRDGARLMTLDGDTGAVGHARVIDLPALLDPRDLLVFNDTRVMRARLLGHKETGGAVEVLVERVVGPGRALAHVRASKSPRPGTRLQLGQDRNSGVTAIVTSRAGDLFELEFEDVDDVPAMLEEAGHVPLPPYIRRADEAQDAERYQTLWAREPGAVAAPTAGLHFSDALLKRIGDRGVATAFVTLHVGAGTFQPVRVSDLDAHVMHEEFVSVSAATMDAIAECRSVGGRVVAVGTTVVRALESAASSADPGAGFQGMTDIFIRPGYRFRLLDALMTNFHLPQSTLLMLVSALAGRARVLAAYEAAVAERYRFFSYGDAMFITPDPDSMAPLEYAG